MFGKFQKYNIDIIKCIIVNFCIYILYFINILRIKILTIKLALWIHRVSYNPSALRIIKSFYNNHLSKPMFLELASKPVTIDEAACRCLIIRWPIIESNKVISKGIIIITFTKTSTYFLHLVEISVLNNFFDIVLEPSWAGYSDPDILSWMFFMNNPLFIQSSEIKDMAALNILHEKIVPISIGASDWVDYNIFSPQKFETKIYDSVYVANTSPGKRVSRYLEAIKEIKIKKIRYRAALVCSSWGGNKRDIIKIFKREDLQDYCEVFFDLKSNDVRKIICKSKVNLLLSLKEGSNRSLFEAMFCNTPVICLINNIGVNKFYINEFTGILTWDEFLCDSLIRMSNTYTRYSSREWAMNNITPEISTIKLCKVISRINNDSLLLSDISKNKINYTHLFIKVNRPEIEYLHYPHFKKIDFNKFFLQTFHKESKFEDIHLKLKELRNYFNKAMSL
jgi:glycosyltransferase involved in cell wall biosynthesis